MQDHLFKAVQMKTMKKSCADNENKFANPYARIHSFMWRTVTAQIYKVSRDPFRKEV